MTNDQKRANEMQKCQYYCPNCGHTITFTLGIESKICGYCRVKVSKPRKSVYDITRENFYKRRYLEFLKKKEGI